MLLLSTYFTSHYRTLFKRLWPFAVLPIVLILCVPTLQKRAATISDQKFESNSERLQMWKAGWAMFKDRPFLGVGAGNVRLASPAYQTPEQQAAYGPWGHLHNMYINFAVERGALGLLAFLVFIATAGCILLRGYRRIPEVQTQRRILVLTALLSLVGWLISGMTETIYNDTSILMNFYFVIGMGLVYCKTWSECNR
jgi:O-antigen ligase